MRDIDRSPETRVMWAYRFLLGRDAEPAAIEAYRGIAEHELLGALFSCAEYRARGRHYHPLPAAYHALLDPTSVYWAFRILLRRDPGEGEMEGFIASKRSVGDLATQFISSIEFARHGSSVAPLRTAHVFGAFTPFSTEPAPKGSFRNFVGALTKCEFLGPTYAFKSGVTDTDPWDNGLHGIAEWQGTLRAVQEAGSTMTVMELGAGWAPWLVSSALAARKLGKGARLVGVEGSDSHYRFMREHFTDNGLDPADHRLIHGVVGVTDGVARFPKLHADPANYGASATFANAADDMEEVQCVGLSRLIEETGFIDLLHIDIQGHELEVVTSAIDLLDTQVRRMIIGTHSREIEGGLFRLLGSRGWWCEDELPSAYLQDHMFEMKLNADGEQVWRNPRL